MQRVPKIIHQTWIERDHPWIKEGERLWLDINPDYEYRFYTDNDITEFMREHFDDEVNECYSRINCGALRADFFRYCVLYIKGGVYADIDHRPDKGDKPAEIDWSTLSNVIEGEDECVFVSQPVYKSQNLDIVFNAFLISVPGHPIFLEMIKKVCSNIKNNLYRTGNEIHLCSGTEVVIEAIKKVVGCEEIPCHGYITPHIKFLRSTTLNSGIFHYIMLPHDMSVNYDTSFEVDQHIAGIFITPETETKGTIFLVSQLDFPEKYTLYNDEDKHKHYGSIEYTYN